MFGNARLITANVKGVGRVTINDRWSATMPDREAGIAWLREHGSAGMIQETVNAQTLGAHAKDMAMAKTPLPSEVFKVTAKPYTSITKA